MNSVHLIGTYVGLLEILFRSSREGAELVVVVALL